MPQSHPVPKRVWRRSSRVREVVRLNKESVNLPGLHITFVKATFQDWFRTFAFVRQRAGTKPKTKERAEKQGIDDAFRKFLKFLKHRKFQSNLKGKLL